MIKSIATLTAMITSGCAHRSGAATACFAPAAKRQRKYLGVLGLALALTRLDAAAALPPGCQGKPFDDSVYKGGPQVIPGRVECAYFDLGGEGVAYHDTDAVNNGNGVLNQQKNHQRPHATPYHWTFRTNEGVDMSYTKDFADFNHNQDLVSPPTNQLYVGWADNGEWCNYTVDVKKAGRYKITALYGNEPNSFKFSINNQPACECKFPVHTGSMHKWNKARVGTITVPETGLQLLTLHYNKGNNFAYFEFEPDAADASGSAKHGSNAAGDWPQFHGPNRDSLCAETGLLQEWPEGGPKLIWKCTGLGSGYATIAIANGKFFTTGDRKLPPQTNRFQYVMAFYLNTQSNLWTSRIGLPGQNGACSTPTVDGPRLYAISGDGNLVCLETDTGKDVWRKSLTRDFDGKVMEQWKYSESPLVDGEQVVCTPGGKEATMVALNKKNGELIWKCPRPNIARPENKPGAGYGSIVVAEVEGLKHYITVTGVGAMGVAADTGKLLWSHNRIANYTANIPTPLVRSNYVFLIAGYETGANLLKLVRAGDLINAEEIYYLGRSKMGQSGFINCHGGVVLVGDYIYGAHGDHGPPGNPTCIEFSTGKIMWKEKPPTKPGSASVLYADNRIIWRYADGTVFLIEPSPQEFRIKGQFKAAVNVGDAWAHPVIHRGRLYLRSQDTLMCYDIRSSQ